MGSIVTSLLLQLFCVACLGRGLSHGSVSVAVAFTFAAADGLIMHFQIDLTADSSPACFSFVTTLSARGLTARWRLCILHIFLTFGVNQMDYRFTIALFFFNVCQCLKFVVDACARNRFSCFDHRLGCFRLATDLFEGECTYGIIAGSLRCTAPVLPLIPI